MQVERQGGANEADFRQVWGEKSGRGGAQEHGRETAPGT